VRSAWFAERQYLRQSRKNDRRVVTGDHATGCGNRRLTGDRRCRCANPATKAGFAYADTAISSACGGVHQVDPGTDVVANALRTGYAATSNEAHA
jgi:hypothetical protein